MKRIYLDYAATTPVDPEVFKIMKPYFADKWGNAGSLHSFGQEAMRALDESREKVAKAINADFREIIFTGSATEANNLALKGVVDGLNLAPRRILKPRIVVSAIEHESVLETARGLEKEGVEVVYLPVDKNGLVEAKKLKRLLNERTVLVSVMYANNEIGSIQPIKEIAKLIKNFKAKNNSPYPLFHTDAVQAFQFFDCDVNKLGVDLMTLSGHKIYGPKGVGMLYKRLAVNGKRFYAFHPLIAGGGQEFGSRSGTENIPSIVGFAKAMELAVGNQKKESERISSLRDLLLKELKKINSEIKINGSLKNRLPNNLDICFPGKSAEDLLMKFDLAGVAVSAGSACLARSSKPSYVLEACGLPVKIIKSSLRISLGKFTTKEEIKEVVKKIGPIV